MATKQEKEQITQILLAIGRLETLIQGENGGGLVKRAQKHGEQIDQLNEDLAVLETKHEECPAANGFDPAKCADHDKRISLNAFKLSLLTGGGGVLGGSVVAVINHAAGGA